MVFSKDEGCQAVHTPAPKAGLWESGDVRAHRHNMHAKALLLPQRLHSISFKNIKNILPSYLNHLALYSAHGRISSGLSGMGPPKSNSKTEPSFQYFTPCPILLTSANARTHGAMVTYANHSFTDLLLRCSAAQTFPCADRKVFFQIFE